MRILADQLVCKYFTKVLRLLNPVSESSNAECSNSSCGLEA